MQNLLEESKRIKSQADKILKESGIVDILGGYGEVKIAGSYALDVMLRPDLDLYVVAEKHDWDKVIEIQSKIIRKKYFRDVYFIDWLNFENKQAGSVEEWIPSIKGYYFATVIPVEDQRWKMDIWLITPEYDKSAELTEHFKVLLDKADESKKLAILEIKNAMREGKKYKTGVDGKLIYKAVLENGITNVEDFKKFLLKQKK
jgi:hypothetical protein